VDSACQLPPIGFRVRGVHNPRLAGHRTAVWLQRHLAAGDQHRYDYRHVPDGVLIQNTQNRELLNLKELSEADLERLMSRYEALGRAAREDLLRGTLDTDTPDVPAEGRTAASSWPYGTQRAASYA
jgi:hypothetical protein